MRHEAHSHHERKHLGAQVGQQGATAAVQSTQDVNSQQASGHVNSAEASNAGRCYCRVPQRGPHAAAAA